MNSQHETNDGGLPWKTAVHASANALEDEILLTTHSGPKGQIANAARQAAASEIADARLAVMRPRNGFRLNPKRLVSWAYGADQETAWLALHAADSILTLARPADAVRAEVPRLLSRVASFYPAKGDPGARFTKALEEAASASTPLNRETIREIKRSLHAESDKAFERMRSFRNILAAATLILALVTISLAFANSNVNSTWLPLCPAPATSAAATTATAKGSATTTPPAAAAKPPATDTSGSSSKQTSASSCTLDSVWQVELLGALGGLLAALTSLQGLRGYRNPYNLPFVQAILKVPAGALTGLLGVILIQSGVFFLEPVTSKQLVAYAIFFGAAQQLVTRLIDQKAGSIADAADPKTSPAAGK